eukprot:PhF_6_TR36020/c1_g1_i1/m.52214
MPPKSSSSSSYYSSHRRYHVKATVPIVTVPRDEMESFTEFWTKLSNAEKLTLLSVDCTMLLNNLKEECNGICTCSVCGGQRNSINAEIERLFKLYCDEITQQMAMSRKAICHVPPPPTPTLTAEDCATALGTGISLSGNRLCVTESWLKMNQSGLAALDVLEKISRMNCRVKRNGTTSTMTSGSATPDPELTEDEDVVSDEEDEEEEEDDEDTDFEDIPDEAYDERRHWDESKKLFLVHVAKLMAHSVWMSYKERVALDMQRKLLEAELMEQKHQEKEKQKKLKQQQQKEAKKQQKKGSFQEPPESYAVVESPPPPPVTTKTPQKVQKKVESDEESERERQDEIRRKQEEKAKIEKERKKEMQKRRQEREKEKKKLRASESVKVSHAPAPEPAAAPLASKKDLAVKKDKKSVTNTTNIIAAQHTTPTSNVSSNNTPSSSKDSASLPPPPPAAKQLTPYTPPKLPLPTNNLPTSAHYTVSPPTNPTPVVSSSNVRGSPATRPTSTTVPTTNMNGSSTPPPRDSKPVVPPPPVLPIPIVGAQNLNHHHPMNNSTVHHIHTVTPTPATSTPPRHMNPNATRWTPTNPVVPPAPRTVATTTSTWSTVPPPPMDVDYNAIFSTPPHQTDVVNMWTRDFKVGGGGGGPSPFGFGGVGIQGGNPMETTYTHSTGGQTETSPNGGGYQSPVSSLFNGRLFMPQGS